MSDLTDIIRDRMTEAVSDAMGDLDPEDFGLIDAEDVRDKLYDLMVDAQALAAEVSNLKRSDISDIESDIDSAAGYADELVNALENYHGSISAMNPDTPMADALNDCFDERRAAQIRLNKAKAELQEAEKAAKIADLRYQRQALWIKRDELRQQLEQVEAQVSKITLSGDTAPYPNDR